MIKRAATLFFVLSFLLIGQCRTTAVVPRQPAAGDTYCIYKVTAARGGGAIPVNSQLCIYCPPPATKRCAATLTIRVADGIEYDLTNVSNTCVTCPAGVQTYQ